MAEAAEEDRRAGSRPVTPWWRVLADNGSLNPKLPRGQAERLRAEGHALADRARSVRVREFEKRRVALP